ncbi:hypothetical protein NQT62_02455 [Limnobacter humi]|uniref:Uncharacterized protein n=1 Tax=Limnobacter humi TaxID=1778671 RepID=A0ABT1WCQ7_9BURK|nr:hypothetical protein [Limnobacter humi]MCQ8895300.1 hypothetical protein [Limnobacter humi]
MAPSCTLAGLLFFTRLMACFTGLVCKMGTVMQLHPLHEQHKE